MANEIAVAVSLQVNQPAIKQNFQSLPQSFTANQINAGGPVPGTVKASPGGVQPVFTPLIQPGMCVMQNLDPVNYVTVGIWDSTTSAFYPLFEMLPGEQIIGRLSRFLGQELAGTGTHEGHAAHLQIEPPHGSGASPLVNVMAFDT